MTHDPDPGPLASIALFEDEAGLITPDGPLADLPIADGQVPVAELVAHLRALDPRAVVVLPADPMPHDQSAYDRAHGAILAVLTLLNIPVEQPPRIVRRMWH